MGVPMVQSKARRRSSLIWGSLLAILLGVAAAFFVLAMPISLLETITTMTRLSKLMVQAEPPISPNDRTLLAVLAGISVSAVGWVMLDWLLFGKAGLSAIMPGREDEYEDEDDDAFRPTDPLDLIGNGGSPLARQNDWAQGGTGNDPRRPLSARTDIGDPPAVGVPFLPGVGDSFPAAGQILPGAGVAAPPLPPVLGASPLPPLQPPASPAWSADPLPSGRASWPPLDETVLPEPLIAPMAPVAPSIPAAPTARVASDVPPGMPSWLPAPGARIDDNLPSVDPATGEAGVATPVSPIPAAAEAPGPMAGSLSPVEVPDILAPFAPASPAVTQVPPAHSVVPQAEVPFELDVTAPEIPQPVASTSPVSTAAPWLSPQTPPAPESVPPAPEWPVAAVSPLAPASVANHPAPARAGGAGLDRARLEELLERLERSLESRRAAAAQAPAQPSAAIAPSPAPQPPLPTPQPSVAVPPAFAAPVAPRASDLLGTPNTLPPQPATNVRLPVDPLPSPPIAPITFSAPEPSMPIAPKPVPAAPVPANTASAANDALLEQPLHMTLEQLRQMIRR